MPEGKSHSFWKFTHFTSEGYMYRERWERDNPLLKEELMMIAHNYDPLYGSRMLTRNQTHFGSKNSWYAYKRFIISTGQDEDYSWRVEVHPTAENMDKPYSKAHHEFEVMMPEEFLDEDLFMKINTEPHPEADEKNE